MIETMGNKLKHLRNGKGMTQKQVADLIHVSRVTYQAYESGRREPGRENMLKLAEIFEVPLAILMDDYSELINAERIKESPVYGRRKNDDEALLKLAHNMTFSEYWEFYNFGYSIIARREAKNALEKEQKSGEKRLKSVPVKKK